MHCRRPRAFPPANGAEDARSSAPTLQPSVSSHGPAACATPRQSQGMRQLITVWQGKAPDHGRFALRFWVSKLVRFKCPSADQTNKQTHCNTHALRTAHKRHQIVQLDKTKIRHPICCMRIIYATSCKLQKLNRNPAEIEQREDQRPSETMSP